MSHIIKNCPFCDSAAELMTTADPSDHCFDKNGNLIQYYDVRCLNEECYLQQGAGWWMNTPDEIIEMWNTRNKSVERDRRLDDLGID